MGALLLVFPLAILMAPFTFIIDVFEGFGGPVAEVFADWMNFFGA